MSAVQRAGADETIETSGAHRRVASDTDNRIVMHQHQTPKEGWTVTEQWHIDRRRIAAGILRVLAFFTLRVHGDHLRPVGGGVAVLLRLPFGSRRRRALLVLLGFFLCGGEQLRSDGDGNGGLDGGDGNRAM